MNLDLVASLVEGLSSVIGQVDNVLAASLLEGFLLWFADYIIISIRLSDYVAHHKLGVYCSHCSMANAVAQWVYSCRYVVFDHYIIFELNALEVFTLPWRPSEPDYLTHHKFKCILHIVRWQTQCRSGYICVDTLFRSWHYLRTQPVLSKRVLH